MFQRFLLISLLIITTSLEAEASESLHSFTINGEPINPVCIGRMRPEASEQGIIIKSIVLEKCQNSNWGFHANPVVTNENTVSTEIDGEPFEYEVLGRTDSNLIIVRHTGNNIAAYRIDEQVIKPDLLKPNTEKVHILTIVSDSFAPCFKKAIVKGDSIAIEKQVYNSNAARAEQCTNKIEKVEYIVK